MKIEVVKYARIKHPDNYFYKVLINDVYKETFGTEQEAIDYADKLFKNNGSEIINEETIKTYNNAS